MTTLPFERMNQRRLQLNLSYSNFSTYCDVSLQTIYSWCDGLSEPNSKDVINICQVLKVSSNWLLYGYNNLREFLALNIEEYTLLESTYAKSSNYLIDKLIMTLMVENEMKNLSYVMPVDMASHSFHQRILTRQNDLNLKKSQIARFCHVDSKSVTNWLNGSSTPRISTLKRLALVLEVPSDWLLTGVLRPDVAQLPSSIYKYILYLNSKIDNKPLLTEKILRLTQVVSLMNDLFIIHNNNPA